MCALVSDESVLMAWANQSAVAQNHGRGGPWHIEFGNSYGYISRLDEQFHIAQPQGLASRKPGFSNRFPVDEGPVGRTAITDEELAVAEHNSTMFAGNRGVFDLEIVAFNAAKAVDPQVQLEHLAAKAFGFDY